MRFTLTTLVIASLLLSHNLFGQNKNEAPLSKYAPADKPLTFKNKEALKREDSVIAPYVAQARNTLPDVKKHYLKGLNHDEAFFLTIRIFDSLGHFEQIFVRVKSWNDNSIKGTIASQLNVVKGFYEGEMLKFTEKDILDWLISKSDGSEEGNYVGKFIDSQQH